MMLDVLSQLPVIQVCVAYEIDGHRTTTFPSHVDELRKVTPVYEQHPGWERDITEARSMQDLPPRALQYLERICELVGQPVGVVSVGADRDQTIFSAEGRRALNLET
jgi:adenylosuccinate synthase